MTHKKTIKRIQELVPSIMELEFGCRIKHKKRGYGTLIDSTHLVFENEKESISAPFIYGNCTILGKPITLAVVLMAIQEAQIGLILVSQNGRFHKRVGVQQHIELGDWNLSKDNFNDQSEETKIFIGELLNN